MYKRQYISTLANELFLLLSANSVKFGGCRASGKNFCEEPCYENWCWCYLCRRISVLTWKTCNLKHDRCC